MMFDEAYFLRGKQTGVSLYEDYRWMPNLTMPMARCIVDYLKLRYTDRVLDFGCARGYLVRALRMLGYCAWGFDTSEWAVANCDPYVREFMVTSTSRDYEWILAKDVLEHVLDVPEAVDRLMIAANVGVFAVVPLAHGPRYDVEEYEGDITHLHRWNLGMWAGVFMRPGWAVTASYRVRGVKDNYAHHQRGNGFITARRV
jgi:ribosomal protein L11 methylase PrmA